MKKIQYLTVLLKAHRLLLRFFLRQEPKEIYNVSPSLPLIPLILNLPLLRDTQNYIQYFALTHDPSARHFYSDKVKGVGGKVSEAINRANARNVRPALRRMVQRQHLTGFIKTGDRQTNICSLPPSRSALHLLIPFLSLPLSG